MINSFTKTHVKFLEHTAIKQAIEINRWKLDNSSASNLPHVTESMEADLLDCFETNKILLSTLGFPLFEPISRVTVTTKNEGIFMIKSKEIVADGNLIDDGFVVFKGSEAKLNTTPSCHKYLIDLRIFFARESVIVQSNNCYQFVEDYVFSSPSTAGGVILGRATNGWTKWRNSEGKTLDEVRRKSV